MHLNWLGPVGGSLSGTLPNPGLSADAFIQAKVFAPHYDASLSLPIPDTNTFQIVELARTFSPRPSVNLPDMSNIYAFAAAYG